MQGERLANRVQTDHSAAFRTNISELTDPEPLTNRDPMHATFLPEAEWRLPYLPGDVAAEIAIPPTI